MADGPETQGLPKGLGAKSSAHQMDNQHLPGTLADVEHDFLEV